MADTSKVETPLGDLGADSSRVEALYGELRASFDRELAQTGSADDLKKLRDRWLGRKQGLLTATNDHWLKTAPRELKPVVGKLQNSLKNVVEQSIEAAASRLEKVTGEPEIDVTL